jgi:hypothetical protein
MVVGALLDYAESRVGTEVCFQKCGRWGKSGRSRFPGNGPWGEVVQTLPNGRVNVMFKKDEVIKFLKTNHLFWNLPIWLPSWKGRKF